MIVLHQRTDVLKLQPGMSSDSSTYETTYSGDIRIERELLKERDENILKNQQRQYERKNNFEKIWKNKNLGIFKLRALEFTKFTHERIKFSFTPSKIVKYVNKNIIFYCRLKYMERYKIWNITKRNLIPLQYKSKIYNLFNYSTVTDESVFKIIKIIYGLLIEWSKEEEKFRIEKFKNIKDEIEIDTDDEEIFLNKTKRRLLHERRNIIWKRMLPPKEQIPPRKLRRKPVAQHN